MEFELLLSLASWTDDFIILNNDVRETYLRIEYAFEKLNRISDNNPLTGLPGNLYYKDDRKTYGKSKTLCNSICRFR